MTQHGYNTKGNSISEGNLIPDVNSISEKDDLTPSIIQKLEEKLLSRMDGLSAEIVNMKDVIIKNLQIDNERLRKKVDALEDKVIALEKNENLLEQYGRRNNLEITGIPDNVSHSDLENKVLDILNSIDVKVTSVDIEACHRIGKSMKNSKRTIVRFVNRKFSKQALYNRKRLAKIDKHSLGLSNTNLFLNENLTIVNNRIAFHCRSLKRNGLITKTYTTDGIVHIAKTESSKPQKILHLNELVEMFPDFQFEENVRNHEDNS